MSKKKYRTTILFVPIVLGIILCSSIVLPISATSWPPGTYIGYAEDGEDLSPNGHYDTTITFNSSGERVWFHWEEESFGSTHESHYYTVFAWPDENLDVYIGAVRNIYWFEMPWAIGIDEGEEGYDEVWSHQWTLQTADYPGWDDEYCSVFIYVQSGSGDCDIRIFVSDS
jgi:hypothetical protein